MNGTTERRGAARKGIKAAIFGVYGENDVRIDDACMLGFFQETLDQ